MSGHTPGPWIISQPTGYNDSGAIEQIGTGFVIASDIFGKSKEETEANARLMAAAPDLLAACKVALYNLASPESLRHILEDAINKAEGGHPDGNH